MTSQPSYRSPTDPRIDEEVANAQAAETAGEFDGTPDWLAEAEAPSEPGAGGRAVLGWTLGLLSAAWIGFAAWSAGRSLGAGPLSPPAIAQWLAILAGHATRCLLSVLRFRQGLWRTIQVGVS